MMGRGERGRDRGGRCGDAGWGLESLEARLVLSITYYGWVGVDTLPGFAAEYGEPDAITGISENGRFMWSEASADPNDPDEAYLVIDGEVRYLRDLPGLTGLTVHAINSDGTVLAREHSDDGGRLLTSPLPDFGARDYLDERNLSGDSGLDLAAAVPLSITDGGGILLQSEVVDSGFYALWILRGQELSRLWEVDPVYREERIFWWLSRKGELLIDTNASDAVVGYRYVSDYGVAPMLWTPQAGVVDLTEFTRVGSINDDGTIVARYGDSLVLWRDGEIIPTGLEDPEYNGNVNTMVVSGSRTANGDFIVTWISGSRTYSSGSTALDYSVGHADMLDFHHRSLDYRARFTESGHILDFTAGWYQAVDNTVAAKAVSGADTILWVSSDGTSVQTQSEWSRGLRLDVGSDGAVRWTLDFHDDRDVANMLDGDTMVNPVTGEQSLVTRSPHGGLGLLLYGQSGYLRSLDSYQIASRVAGFFRDDGRLIVAGLDANGGLQLAFEPFAGNHRVWEASLSGHLAQRGQSTPLFTSNLDSFITPWGAMNIVGLDDAGDLHAVWWSPGLGSSLWTTSNLSAISGAPRLVGNITASATQWNGMQVFGTDERGNAIAIWWSPGSGGWRWSDLTSLTGGEALEAGSLTGAATRWGAIELVGRTADDQVVTYWWAPGSGGWVYESITLRQVGDTPRIVGPVSMTVAGDGAHHLAGVSAEGEVVHLYWLPDGSDLWRGENLTQLALG